MWQNFLDNIQQEPDQFLFLSFLTILLLVAYLYLHLTVFSHRKKEKK